MKYCCIALSETEFNQANMVREIIDGVRNELVQDSQDDDEANNFITQMANAAVNNQQVIPQIITQVQQLSQLVLQLQSQLQTQATSPPRTTNRYYMGHALNRVSIAASKPMDITMMLLSKIRKEVAQKIVDHPDGVGRMKK